ncbi:dihydrofolate reductase [Microcystis phage MaeS]|nr:dihydrofolate reductase [Microcystis phage MaeS]
MITLIVAHDVERNIGKENTLPWGKLPNDLAYFKSQTVGKIVVMGRKTFESIGRPLPNRKNYVVTRDPEAFKKKFPDVDVTLIQNVDDIVTIKSYLKEDIFVIGGEEIYTQMFPRADRVLYSLIHTKIDDCDKKFPDPAVYGQWEEKFIGYLPADEENEFGVSFHELVKEEGSWQKEMFNHFI